MIKNCRNPSLKHCSSFVSFKNLLFYKTLPKFQLFHNRLFLSKFYSQNSE